MVNPKLPSLLWQFPTFFDFYDVYFPATSTRASWSTGRIQWGFFFSTCTSGGQIMYFNLWSADVVVVALINNCLQAFFMLNKDGGFIYNKSVKTNICNVTVSMLTLAVRSKVRGYYRLSVKDKCASNLQILQKKQNKTPFLTNIPGFNSPKTNQRWLSNKDLRQDAPVAGDPRLQQSAHHNWQSKSTRGHERLPSKRIYAALPRRKPHCLASGDAFQCLR